MTLWGAIIGLTRTGSKSLQNVEVQLVDPFSCGFGWKGTGNLQEKQGMLLEVLQRANCHVLNNPRNFGSFYDPADNLDVISNLFLLPRKVVLISRYIQQRTRGLTRVFARWSSRRDKCSGATDCQCGKLVREFHHSRHRWHSKILTNGVACGVLNESAMSRIHLGALLCGTDGSQKRVPFALNFGVTYVMETKFLCFIFSGKNLALEWNYERGTSRSQTKSGTFTGSRTPSTNQNVADKSPQFIWNKDNISI